MVVVVVVAMKVACYSKLKTEIGPVAAAAAVGVVESFDL